jgi:hypothetical protein
MGLPRSISSSFFASVAVYKSRFPLRRPYPPRLSCHCHQPECQPIRSDFDSAVVKRAMSQPNTSLPDAALTPDCQGKLDGSLILGHCNTVCNLCHRLKRRAKGVTWHQMLQHATNCYTTLGNTPSYDPISPESGTQLCPSVVEGQPDSAAISERKECIPTNVQVISLPFLTGLGGPHHCRPNILTAVVVATAAPSRTKPRLAARIPRTQRKPQKATRSPTRTVE